MNENAIHITESDRTRLEKLLAEERAKHGGTEPLTRLSRELERAVMVAPEALPADVVSMNSTVELIDLDTGDVEVYTLVFPEEADLDRGKLSVLAPIGMAMLGYRVGDVFEWEVPAGTRRLRVSRLLYQPEASGDFDL